jgi:hypothetical protein
VGYHIYSIESISRLRVLERHHLQNNTASTRRLQHRRRFLSGNLTSAVFGGDIIEMYHQMTHGTSEAVPAQDRAFKADSPSTSCCRYQPPATFQYGQFVFSSTLLHQAIPYQVTYSPHEPKPKTTQLSPPYFARRLHRQPRIAPQAGRACHRRWRPKVAPRARENKSSSRPTSSPLEHRAEPEDMRGVMLQKHGQCHTVASSVPRELI